MSFFIIRFFYFEDIDKYNFLQCPSKSLLGVKCAGCGGTHAAYYLLHGDLLTALSYNPLILFFVLFLFYVLAAYIFFRTTKKVLFKRFVSNPIVWIVIFGLLIIYSIARNLWV